MPIDYKIQYHEKVSSTNDTATDMIGRKLAAHGSVIVAGFQSSGKGQRSNIWFSDPLINLTMSIILKPNFLLPEEQFYISKIVSIAITDSLSNFSNKFSIKWPNDIYHGSDKIAGILIENSIIGNSISDTVCGIGLNINQKHFPKDLPNPISLTNITGTEHNTQDLQNNILNRLSVLYDYIKKRKYNTIDKSYLERLYQINKESEFRAGDKYFRGTIKGINKQGQLLIRPVNGPIRSFSFKEVEFL